MPAPPPPIGEFELIARYFQRGSGAAPRVELGIGDDCALIDGGPESQWAVTTDMLVEGVHFLADVDPEALGHKALAVNLSDLAACGATPRCFFLALALPAVDEPWLAAFSRGIFSLADRFGCALAGGDTTRSVQGVTISITALGDVPRGSALLRSGALAGDEIWVSGTLGDGALGLACRRGAVEAAADAASQAIARLERPEPRVGLGERLRGIASSAIDVSDGLAGDLGHILEAFGRRRGRPLGCDPALCCAAATVAGAAVAVRVRRRGRLRTAVHGSARRGRGGRVGGPRQRSVGGSDRVDSRGTRAESRR